MSGQLVESTVAPTVADAELQFLHRRKRHLLGRGHLMRRALLAADVVGLTAAFMISLAVMPNGPRTAGVGMAGEAGLFLISIPIWVLLLKLYGLYTRDGERTDHSTVDDVRGIFEAVTIGTWLYVLFGFVTGLTHTPLLRTTVFWLSAILLVSALRVVARAICRLSPQYMQNALILGAGSVGQHIGAKIVSRSTG
jgi:FlaA1/EpsC-like NDP-sugar epimerase